MWRGEGEGKRGEARGGEGREGMVWRGGGGKGWVRCEER